MRSPVPAALAVLALTAALSACTPEPAGPNAPEALPYPSETIASPSPSASPSAIPSPSASSPAPAAPDDPAAEIEAFYSDHDIFYPGASVAEEVSLGLCAQFADDNDRAVGTAFRELVTLGGYPGDEAAAAVIAATAYCPEHKAAVEDWSAAVEGVDDWAESVG